MGSRLRFTSNRKKGTVHVIQTLYTNSTLACLRNTSPTHDVKMDESNGRRMTASTPLSVALVRTSGLFTYEHRWNVWVGTVYSSMIHYGVFGGDSLLWCVWGPSFELVTKNGSLSHLRISEALSHRDVHVGPTPHPRSSCTLNQLL